MKFFLIEREIRGKQTPKYLRRLSISNWHVYFTKSSNSKTFPRKLKEQVRTKVDESSELFSKSSSNFKDVNGQEKSKGMN